MFGKERGLKNEDTFTKLFYKSVYVDVLHSKFHQSIGAQKSQPGEDNYHQKLNQRIVV